MAKSSGSDRNYVLADVVGGLIIIAVGAAFIVNSLQFGILGEEGRLAPGAMPFFSGLALALCGLGVAANAFSSASRRQEAARERKAEANDPAHEESSVEHNGAHDTDAGAPIPAASTTETSQRVDGDAQSSTPRDETDPDDAVPDEVVEPGMGKAMIVLASAVVATWLASRIGFLLAFALVPLGLWIGLEREHPLKAALITAGVIAFMYLLFVRFLSIPVPETFFL